MSYESRLEIERKKYIDAYANPGYKMGGARFQHAYNAISNWKRGSYLDVGCGRGEMLDAANKLEFTRIQGTEIVPKLADAREDVIFADGGNLPFEDDEFDYVSMLDVVEHIPAEDINNIFKELARVAKKKILLCIANFSHRYRGEELHINLKPYPEWDKILKEQFPDWEVVWLPRGNNISETWELTKK